MPWLRQLELVFGRRTKAGELPRRGQDRELEQQARHLLTSLGAEPIATRVQVEWNPRFRTCAGQARCRHLLIRLNPRLHEHGEREIDLTLRHELAHLLAWFRARGRRIRPHGPEWRAACRDLGIPGEKRCHDLQLALARRAARRLLYHCPGCRREFPRVRRIRRTVACLVCCRAHNRGKYDERFRLKLVRR